MRGYAPSEIPSGTPPEPARLGLDLLGLGRLLSADQPFSLIGHDWGAIASYAAAQIDPSALRSLVTMAVPPLPAVLHAMEDPRQLDRSWYLFAFQDENYEFEVQRDDFALIRRLWSDWSPGLDAPQELGAAIDALREPARTTAALDYYRVMLDPARRDPAMAENATRLIDPIVVPTLYLHGGVDGCMGLDAIGEVAPWLPEGSAVEILKDAGHFLHLEEPARVAQLVLSFLAAH
jgi:pimeloyl-ACP methyl ester carboxylesterase